MKNKTTFLLLVLLLGGQLLYGQRQVAGKVTSSGDGSSIPSASVVVKGTQTGVNTDSNGEYRIRVPNDDAILIFSFVGMKRQEVPVQGRSVINVEMDLESTELANIIVVGYTTQAKESITGSVGLIATEATEQAPATSVDKLLQGQVAGVYVTSGSGQPGSFSNVQIRGVGSINAGTEPLYVLDGVPINSGDLAYLTTSANALSSLNPNDIESISILKDASASAIYGSRAANGVVLITTKQGKEGKAKVELKTQFGITSLSNKNYEMCNSSELLELQREAVANSGKSWQEPMINGEPNPYYLPDSLARTDTDWFDVVSRIGYYQDYMLSASGGDARTTYYTSVQYNKTEGAIIGQDFQRLSARLNVNHNSKERLSFGMNIAPSYTFGNWTFEGFAYESPIIAAQTISPMNPVYNMDGSVNWNIPENGNSNPVGIDKFTEKTNNNIRFIGNVYSQIKIFDWLSFKLQVAGDMGEINERNWRSPQTVYGTDGPLYKDAIRNTLWSTTSLLSFNKTIHSSHKIDGIIAHEAQKSIRDFFYAYGKGTNDDNPYLNAASRDLDVDETVDEWSMLSYFTTLSYSYDNKYYVSTSLRSDGSSKFGTNNKWATFGSVGLRWRVNAENFLKDSKAVDALTLRASYGTTGNSDIGNYLSQGVYGNTVYNSASGTKPNRFENPDLRWEKSATFNIAAEFGFWNRVAGTVEYYNKKTTDMLFETPLSYTTGFETILQNIGSMKNTGWEFSFSSKNLTGGVKWNTDFNVSFPRNEILDLGGRDSVVAFSATDFLYYPRLRIIGQPVAVFYPYDYAGANPANGNPMWRDANGNLTEEFSEARRINAGSYQPKMLGSITNSLSYRDFSLSFMFYYVYDFMTINAYRKYMEDDFTGVSGNKARALLERWQKPGDVTQVPKPVLNNDSNGAAFGSTRWVTRGDYIRLKDLTFSYDIPEKVLSKINISSLQLFVRGTNLWTRTISPMIDPETDKGGISYSNQPNIRTMTFGLNAGF